MILSHMFESVGVPAARVRILGESALEMENIAESIAELMRTLPPHARALVIVDENLDLPEPSMVTISGSYAIEKARELLTPDEETRLLAFVRSANDSPDEVHLFLERAHGFLTKMPTEPDRLAIRRAWWQRFGADSASGLRERRESEESDASDNGAAGEPAASNQAGAEEGSWSDVNRTAALTELSKASRLLDEGAGMQWNEMWRWIHRIKGIISTVKSSDAGDSPKAGSPRSQMRHTEINIVGRELILSIEELRSLAEPPEDVIQVWADLKPRLAKFMSLVERQQPRPPLRASAPAGVRGRLA